jgi:hypothetical protein
MLHQHNVVLTNRRLKMSNNTKNTVVAKPANVAKKAPAKKPAAKKVVAPKPTIGLVATYCKANGLNPKVVRARLRKAGVAKVDGHYVINDKTRAAMMPTPKVAKEA